MTATPYRRFTSDRNSKRQNRFLASVRQFFATGDFSILIILTALLMTAPYALQAAEWPIDMGVLVPITLLSIVFGLVLARSQFGELLALVVSITYGFCLVLLLAALSLDQGLGQGVYDVFIRTINWLVDATTGGINQDDLVFTLLVSTLFWFLGYNAAWHTFRIDRVWRVILPPGLILVTNIVFHTGDANLDLYLVLFLFMALLLIAQSNLDARQWEWFNNGIKVPPRLRQQFLWVGAVLGIMTIAIGYIVPSGNLQERLDSFQEFLQSDPVTEISEFWNRLFSPVDAVGPTTTDYYGGDMLELSGAIRLGDQTVLLVDAPQDRRYYWRSRVFDTYDFGRWLPAADTQLTDTVSPLDLIVEPQAARVPVEQEFTIALNGTRILYAAPQPLRIDLPTRTDLFYTSDNENDPTRSMSISVVRPMKVIKRGESYTATSLMSNASADQLRATSSTYPEWVSNRYLFVSGSVTQETRQLAFEIITEAGATTPYDQAKAIERYLRANIVYNETIPAPPDGVDPVHWVLFQQKEGYCNYYASAMIVMLRTLGIPARLAAGFAQGNYDPAEGAYVVTERDAHTWVEVYFPGYGWIEFEPTAAQAPLDRAGDVPFTGQQVAQAAPTLTPSPTFTPPPSPTSLPTLTPESDNENQENNQNQPPPTITPSPTPTPTATPVIIPTQPAPMNPDPANPLELVLPAIGLLVVIIFAILLLFALATLIWWWWEWRGMRGLSPIARAYARLERYAGLIGIQLGKQETPEERRGRIVRTIPRAEKPVTAITRIYTTEKYGPAAPPSARSQRVSDIADQAWPDARKHILQRWLGRFAFWRGNR